MDLEGSFALAGDRLIFIPSEATPPIRYWYCMRRRNDFSHDDYLVRYRDIHSQFGLDTSGIEGYTQWHANLEATAAACERLGIGGCPYDRLAQRLDVTPPTAGKPGPVGMAVNRPYGGVPFSATGSVEQFFEGGGSDRSWRLTFPLKEILVASHDPVDAMFTAQRDEVIVIGISCGDHDRCRVADHVGDAPNRGHVQLSQFGIDALAEPRPVQDIFHLGKKRGTDHDLDASPVQPPGDESVRRTGLNRSRDQNVRVKNHLHDWP